MCNQNKECRFLIVDDQELMLNLFKGILKAGGYKKIAFAMTCKAALAIIRKHPIDMIIADVVMPNMNGVELLKLIRKDPWYCDIPFVMITGEMSKDGVIYAMEEGVDDYLIKPVTTNKALGTIERVLGENSNSESIRSKSTNVYRLMRSKQYDKAIALAHRNLEIFENPELYLVLSECYLLKSDLENAMKYAQKVLEIKNDSRAVFLLGKIHMADSDYVRAVERFNESNRMNPLNTGRKIEIATTYIKYGLKKEAEAVFESLQGSEMTDLDCVGIGTAYLSFGNLKMAGEYFGKVVDPISEMIPAFNRYAAELKKNKRYEDCIRQYKICLKIEPDNAVILYNLGCMYFVVRKVDDAMQAIEHAIELKPSFEEAQKMLKYMKLKRSELLKKSTEADLKR